MFHKNTQIYRFILYKHIKTRNYWMKYYQWGRLPVSGSKKRCEGEKPVLEDAYDRYLAIELNYSIQ